MREIIHRIRSLIYWLPVIWNDEDFDHIYLWKIMRHKIAAMARHQRSCPMGRRDDIPDKMERTVELLDDLINEVHEDNAYKAHESLFGKSHWEFIKLTPEELAEKPTLKDCKRAEITYPEAVDQELARKSLTALTRTAVALDRATLDIVGELIKTSDRWWD
jgi:hypothetical protein